MSFAIVGGEVGALPVAGKPLIVRPDTGATWDAKQSGTWSVSLDANQTVLIGNTLNVNTHAVTQSGTWNINTVSTITTLTSIANTVLIKADSEANQANPLKVKLQTQAAGTHVGDVKIDNAYSAPVPIGGYTGSAMQVILVDAQGHQQVDVLTLPNVTLNTLPAGANNIGKVDVNTLPSNVIGGMTTLPAGSNNIGDVDVVSLPSTVLAGMSVLPAGNNNIGNVDVLTLPATPAGSNLIGKVHAGYFWASNPADLTAAASDYLRVNAKRHVMVDLATATATMTVTGTLTANQGGSWVVSQGGAWSVNINAGQSIAATQSGTWNIGTVTTVTTLTGITNTVKVKQDLATDGAFHVEVDAMPAISFATPLPAGTNAIGKLGANNGVDIGDVTVNNAAGEYLPIAGTTSIATPTKTGIRVDTDGHLQTDVLTLPSLPAGNNNIGDVDIASIPSGVLAGMSTLPAGTNNIGKVDVAVLPSLPAGSNNIGDVDIASLPSTVLAGMATLPTGNNIIGRVNINTMPSVTLNALPSGTNNIGDVDVLTLPSNVIAGMASLPTGSNLIGQVDVHAFPSLPAGTNNIGKVDINTMPNVTISSLPAVSGSVSVSNLPTEISTAKYWSSGWANYSATTVDLLRMTNAGHLMVNIASSSATVTISGTVTANQGGTWNISSVVNTVKVKQDYDTDGAFRVQVDSLPDVVIGTSLPSGTNAIGKLAENSGVDIGDVTINNAYTAPVPVGGVNGTTLKALKVDTNGELQVDVLTIPVLPAGSNKIGSVDVASLPAIPAGQNLIGQVYSADYYGGSTWSNYTDAAKTAKSLRVNNTGALMVNVENTHAVTQSGTWNIGTLTSITNTVKVKQDYAIDGGFHVLVDSLPNVTIGTALPAGSNAIGKLAANTGVDIGDVTINNTYTAPVPVAGSTGSAAKAIKVDSDGNVQVDVLTLPTLPAGTNTIGKVEVTTYPALPAGSNVIGHTTAAHYYGGTSWANYAETAKTAKSLRVMNTGSLLVSVENTLPVSQNGTWNVGTVDAITGTVKVKQDFATDGAFRVQVDSLPGVTIGTALPAGANAIGKLAANTGVDIGDVTVNNTYSQPVPVAGVTGTTAKAIKVDSDGDVQVDVLSLPTLPAGTNTIGKVEITTYPALPTGNNVIGQTVTAHYYGGTSWANYTETAKTAKSLRVLNTGSLLVNLENIPAVSQSGTWNIDTITSITGTVKVKQDYATDGAFRVIVDSLPNVTIGAALPAGTNAIGKLAANSGVDIGDVTINNTYSTPVPVAGSTGSAAKALKVDANGELQVDVLTLPALPAGTNTIGKVEVTALPALPTGSNVIGNILSAHYYGGTSWANYAESVKTSKALRVLNTGALLTNIENTIPVSQSGTWDLSVSNTVTVKQNFATDGAFRVQVDSLPTVILGAGTAAIGKLAANGGVDIGDVTINNTSSNPVPVAGLNGSTVKAISVNANGTVQADVLTLPALPVGSNKIGSVDVASLPALPAGTNEIGVALPAHYYGGSSWVNYNESVKTAKGLRVLSSGALYVNIENTHAVTQSGTWNIGTLTSITNTVKVKQDFATDGAFRVQVDSMPNVTVNALPAGTNAIGKLAANNGVDIGDVTINNTNTNPVPVAGLSGTTVKALKVDADGNLQIDVLTLPSLPAGSNNIGDVDVLSLPALPAGTNNIGKVDINSIPTVTVSIPGTVVAGMATLPAGSNKIGSVDVASLPSVTIGTALPAGTNAIGKLAANNAVDIGDVTINNTYSTPVPVAGSTGSAAKALKVNANGELQVDILTLPALPAGTNNIGNVDVASLPELPTGANWIGKIYTVDLICNLREMTRAISTANTNIDFTIALPTGFKAALIEHVMVIPTDATAVWSLEIFEASGRAANESIYLTDGQVGRFDDLTQLFYVDSAGTSLVYCRARADKVCTLAIKLKGRLMA
jgi:hypothetical protein